MFKIYLGFPLKISLLVKCSLEHLVMFYSLPESVGAHDRNNHKMKCSLEAVYRIQYKSL